MIRNKIGTWKTVVTAMAFLGLAMVGSPLIGLESSVLANDAYVGIGLGLSPGQPKFKQSDDLPLQFAFELEPQEWRFSLAQATFDSNDKPTVHLNTQVIGAEKLFVHKFDNRFSINGALGVGYYQVNLSGAASGTGSAFGLMATAGGRFQITPQFFTDLQYQYRNAAVVINSTQIVDAGWNGFAVNVGFTF